jgi:predicted exporter
MTSSKKTINLPWLGAVILTTAVLFAIGFSRITIDTDIVNSLPAGDPVIADAAYIFKNHPVKDRIAIDIGIQDKNPDHLAAIAQQVEQALEKSELFERVGFDDTQNGITELVFIVADQLPLLFSSDDLTQAVAPLLTPESIHAQLEKTVNTLYGMNGIGQARLIGQDPLGLRNLVLAHLARLIPETTGRIHKGRLLSADEKHILILATPRHSGTDTKYAAGITALIEGISNSLNLTGAPVTLTPVGAYRAALDNETIIRKDVGRAIVGATIGIALLLLLAFSRPLIGLMALVPALAGTILAFFVYTLFNDHISIMVIGFGGAIVSITVDHGIAYLLFVDSSGQTNGKEASREIWAIGLLAALTSVGAFAMLSISGFPVFKQLGLFTALGIGFSFLFVHTVFPRLFPALHGTAPARPRFLNRVVDRGASFGTPAAIAAIILAVGMSFFGDLRFNTDLGAMNSISNATRDAEALMGDVWGNIFSNVHLLVEAESPAELQQKNDRLLSLLEKEESAGRLTGGTTPSRFFPGNRRAADNLAAWKQFWTASRITTVHKAFEKEGAGLGFSRNAFDPFFQLLRSDGADEKPTVIPPNLYPLLGINYDTAAGKYRQVAGIKPLKGYDGARFHARLESFVKIFDPALFSERLGDLLFGTFVKMLLIIGISVVVLLFIFFADIGLTLIALLPLLFSFSCTLGTMGLLGRPLDIPALMLAIIIFGMGVDYSLFMVRAYQRYQHFGHPLFRLTRVAVFMAAASTLVGFAVICGAEHNTLKSAGIISFLGIGYCLAGAFLILPPLLKKRFEPDIIKGTEQDSDPVRRYRNMEAYPRLFARFKLRFDPMFSELDRLLPARGGISTIIDIGCGYGVPGSWLLSRYPAARIFGIEPDQSRVRVAAMALGDQGHIIQGAAPQIPAPPGEADLAVMLDMNHFLDDEALGLTFRNIREKLDPDGCLIVRSVIAPVRPRPWAWWIENLKMKLSNTRTFYRSENRIKKTLLESGFEIENQSPSGKHGELQWFVAKPTKD